MEDAIMIGVIVLIVAGIAGFFWWQAAQKKKRIQGFESFGAERDLTLTIDKDFELPKNYPALDLFQEGEKRYAYNVLRGELRGHKVILADYHNQRTRMVRYKDSEGNEKMRTQTDHDHMSFLLVEFPERFPCEMRISPEGWFDRVAQAVGFKEVKVGNEDFDKAWEIKASKPDFAQSVFTPEMQQHISSHRAFKPEIEFDASAMIIQRGDKRFKLDELVTVWHLAEGILERMGKQDPSSDGGDEPAAGSVDAQDAPAADGESAEA